MFSIDVNQNNFDAEVINKSRNVPVVVDFWAPWCGPCRTLKPVLEKLAEEYQGKFILAKVNADQNQALSTQFGVRGIPSVKAFYNGKLVSEFSGAIPETEIRRFLDALIPSKSEQKRQEAASLIKNDDKDNAVTLLEQAIALDSENFQAKIDLAELLMEKNDVDRVRELIQLLPVNLQQEDSVKTLTTKLELADLSANLPDRVSLEKRVAENDKDLQARIDLANLLIREQNYDDALELLFNVISQDKNFGEGIGRKTVLSIFTLLGNSDERVRLARNGLPA